MSALSEALARLGEGLDLSAELAEHALTEIVSGQATDAQLGAFLMGLRVKGESPQELLGCARALRSAAVPVQPRRRPLVDTCGTGGDGASTLNISTLAALTAAACGLSVAKHGNRSVSSRCGSADLLEALGMPLFSQPGEVERCLEELGFAFLFAPHFHPATARVGPARKSLGLRTVFNLLGPVSNPARAEIQLIGVFDSRWLEPLAGLGRELGAEAWMVVHGAGGADELTLEGPAEAVLYRQGELRRLVIDPREAGLACAPLSALQGGDPAQNARLALQVLEGAAGPAADTVALNAGACLMLAGAAKDLAEGVRQAHHALRSGAALDLLGRLRDWRP